MTNMRDILDLINEMSEEEGSVELHDEFDIELSEEVIIESGVIDINDDGILIEGDEKSLQLLEEHGLILEDADWSKYDEPTVSRVKKGVTKLDRTDYNVPPAMRKDNKGKPGYELRKEKLAKMHGKLDEFMDTGSGDNGGGDDDMKDRIIQMYKEDGLREVEIAKLEGIPELEVHKIIDAYERGMDEAKYQGREVPLGKPMAGDVKKKKVYVKKPNGKVVKVNFGDKKMRIKKSNPKRRKSFRARHNCKNPGPRWKARYWSCRAW